jgi:hypothetical protein
MASGVVEAPGRFRAQDFGGHETLNPHPVRHVNREGFEVRTVHGSAARTRIPMVCFDSTFRRALTWVLSAPTT